MNLFLDTSSLLKLYHQEVGTTELMKFVSENVENIYLSEIAKIEFNSAIWKKVRTKELIEGNAKKVIAYFVHDYKNYKWIVLEPGIINLAKELIIQ